MRVSVFADGANIFFIEPTNAGGFTWCLTANGDPFYIF